MDWKVKTAGQIIKDLRDVVDKIKNIDQQKDPPIGVPKVLYDELNKDCPPIRIGGYAPGNYVCICGKCGRGFLGDKRAIRCYPCVVEEQKEKV